MEYFDIVEKYFKIPERHTCGCDDFDIEEVAEKNLRRRKYVEAYCIGDGGCGAAFKFTRDGEILDTDRVCSPIIVI